MHTETNFQGRNAGGWPGCDMSRPVVAGGPKRNGTSHTGWAKCAAWRVDSNSQSRCDQSCQLFRSAQSDDLLRGRSIAAIGAASVYEACRCNSLSRLVGEVS